MSLARPYPPDWLSASEAAYLLSIAESTFRDYVARGLLPKGTECDGLTRWSRQSINSTMAAREHYPDDDPEVLSYGVVAFERGPIGHIIGGPELSELLAKEKTTNIYFALSDGLVKIGIAKDIKARERQFNCDSPHPVRIIAYLPGPPELETYLHNEFWIDHHKGEWFVYSEAIDDFIHETEGVMPTRWLGKTAR